MQNLDQLGGIINYTPSAAVSSGDVVVLGQKIGIAVADIAADATGAVQMKGAFTLAKKSTDDISQGDILFWDAANTQLTLTGTGNTPAGMAMADADTSATEVSVLLSGDFVQMANQAASTASDVAGLVVDFNALLTKLTGAGFMANS